MIKYSQYPGWTPGRKLQAGGSGKECVLYVLLQRVAIIAHAGFVLWRAVHTVSFDGNPILSCSGAMKSGFSL